LKKFRPYIPSEGSGNSGNLNVDVKSNGRGGLYLSFSIMPGSADEK
jgi:hypothetical protein